MFLAHRFTSIGLRSGILSILVVFLSGMGLAAHSQGQTQEQNQEESQTQGAGKLVCLSWPYAGEEILLTDGEELRLGSDAAECQLILELPGEPRCLCAVCWLSGRNCFYFASCESSGLLYEDGRPVPDGVPLEVQPGITFLDGQTGQALFRLE